jgi:hypothetical protein
LGDVPHGVVLVGEAGEDGGAIGSQVLDLLEAGIDGAGVRERGQSTILDRILERKGSGVGIVFVKNC